MAGMLYLVPTPIGNLGDISVRCRKTLAEADFIAAEDTRVTLKLLNYLELKKPLVSYYAHNKAESGPRIVARILAGETCVLDLADLLSSHIKNFSLHDLLSSLSGFLPKPSAGWYARKPSAG